MDDADEGQRLIDKVDAPRWVLRYYARYIASCTNVLSVGCGPGHFLDAIARCYPHLTVTGVDISGARVADARRRNARNSNVVIKQGDIYQTELDTDGFDFVEVRFLFEYLKNKARAMEELYGFADLEVSFVYRTLMGRSCLTTPRTNASRQLNELLISLLILVSTPSRAGNYIHSRETPV